MPNVLDYLATEFASFEDVPLNVVDSVAISQLAMVCGEGIIPELPKSTWLSRAGRTVLHAIPPAKALGASARGVRLTELLRAERYPTMFLGPARAELKETLLHMAASPRYRDIRVGNYAVVFDEETHTQFAAMTLTYKDQFAYVAFRGTDSSIVGWREDFNMSFAAPVPAQVQAIAYLEAVAPLLPKRLYMGGHSKGANLAEYAALKASPKVQTRLERVFLHDGPGFVKGMFSEADYAPLVGRLHKTVPEDAFVGMLLHSHAPMSVVKSEEHSLQQHNVFFWEVDVAGRDFAYADKLSEGGRIVSDVARAWIDSYTEEERRVVVDALFTAIELSGAADILDLFSSPRRTIELLAEAARQVEEPMRDTLTASIRRIAEITADRIGQNVQDLLPRPLFASRREA
ncbi:MAG: DUF2974 domain-containing protein [Eggerthellaceae bacterium]|nr:DUF2974 domain-containing protein [Eggerthellaceae bacterium]